MTEVCELEKKRSRKIYKIVQYFSVEWSSCGSPLECHISGQSSKIRTGHQLQVKITSCTGTDSKRYPRELCFLGKSKVTNGAYLVAEF